ncbi:MAG: hypothetical protein KGD58_04560 [Candidatus Lokiarchaeota archaeon]|nr:hypothetical protein [Candidatus Lokiarchaeota archaeon]
MINGFTIILEEDVLYCSNNKKYSSFEIILFLEKLLRSINPRNTWRLKKICLKDHKIGRERIIVKHIVTKKLQNLFFCIIGDFEVGSEETFKIVNEFSKQVNLHYKNLAELKNASEESTFNDVVSLIVNYLKEKYTEPLEEEIIFDENENNVKNAILYAGISSQGLPIISQLFDINLLLNLAKENTIENIELFTSDLSAKLETISMNTQIRAKTGIKEIHFIDTEGSKNKMIILFGSIKDYSLDFIASGNFYKIKNIFKQFKAKMILDTIFQKEFAGNLKPFNHLNQQLNEIVKDFDD